MRRLVLLGFIVLIILGFAGYVSAITGSVGNARMIVRAQVGEEIDKYIVVKNVNNVSVNIEIWAEGNLSKYIDFKENNFTLAPGGEKKVDFTIKAVEEGTTETKIKIKFVPTEGGNGVGLTSTVIVIAGKDDGTVDDETDIIDESDTASDESDTSQNLTAITGKITDKINNGVKSIGIKGIVILITIVLAIILITLVIFMKKSSKKGFNEEIKPKKRAQNE